MRTRLAASLLAVPLAALCLGATACSSDGDSGSPATDPETFCTLLTSFRANNESLTAEVASGDAGRAKTAVKRLVGQVELLQDRAPADIAQEVDIAADFLTEFDRLMSDNGYDIARIEADENASAAFVELNSDQVIAALDQIRAYGDQDCAGPASSTTAAVGAGTTTTLAP